MSPGEVSFSLNGATVLAPNDGATLQTQAHPPFVFHFLILTLLAGAVTPSKHRLAWVLNLYCLLDAFYINIFFERLRSDFSNTLFLVLRLRS